MSDAPCATCGAPSAGPAPACDHCGHDAGGSRYYRHSGRAPAAGLAAATAAGAAVSAVLGYVYAFVDYVNPFVYINMIGAMALGAVSGFVTGWLLERGRVRSLTAASAAALVAGGAGLYVAWAAWLGATLERTGVGAGSLLASPAAMWSAIELVNRTGPWRIGSSTPTGVVVWAAWAAEAALVLGFAAYASRLCVAAPFCESCGRWCTPEANVLQTRGWDDAELRRRLEGRDFDYLKTLGPRGRGDLEWFAYDLRACPNCGRAATLAVRKVDLVKGEEGGGSRGRVVFEDLRLSPAEADRLRRYDFEPPPVASARGA